MLEWFMLFAAGFLAACLLALAAMVPGRANSANYFITYLFFYFSSSFVSSLV